MPKIKLPVPETTESITRPIMFDVIRQLIEITNLPKDINVLYSGGLERAKQLGSAINMPEGTDPNKFNFNDKITIEVDEDFGEDRILNEPVIGPGNLLIFEDSPLKIIMKPVYSLSDVTITVTYRAANENAAEYWRTSIETALRQRRDILMHDLTYSYQVPDEMLYILKQLHTMREAVDGYGDSYDKYFKEHSHPRMTELTNLSGQASAWTIPETQMRVQGWFDFALPPKATRDGDADTRTISFSYKFNYQRPVQLVMMYPVVVHNQVIPQKFRPRPVETEDDAIQARSLTTRVLSHYESGTEALMNHQPGYSIPQFDEFLPASVPHETMRALTVLFTIDDPTSTRFLKLDELKSKKFTDDILAYMRAETGYMTKMYQSAIMINFYRDEHLILPTPVKINSNLEVHATTPINLRHQHHLRISLVTDLFMLQGNALERLRSHGRAAIQILDAIDPSLKQRGLLPMLIGDNYISKASLLLAMENMRPRNQATGSFLMLAQTVQTLFVQAGRIE